MKVLISERFCSAAHASQYLSQDSEASRSVAIALSLSTGEQYFYAMAADSILSASPIMSASVMQNLNRASETALGVRQAATQETEARQPIGAATIRTGLQMIPSPNDAAAALKSSATQIARLQSNPQQPTAQAASEAYQTQAAARTQITLQAGGSQGINIMA